MSTTPSELPHIWPMSVEHRLTVLEQHMEMQRDLNIKTDKRMLLQERGLIAVIVALNALAHDKLPEWARLLAAVFKAAQQ